MTQIFDKNGDVISVTVIKTGPCVITQIKSLENCGYNAIQVGYTEISANSKSLTKPRLGHFNKVNLPAYRFLKEFRMENLNDYKVGEIFTVENFKIGQFVNISGLSIGKGFAGNVKRNNFATGPKTHGSKHHRLQGSLGAGTTPGRVFPGKKMSGHLGNTKVTIK